MSIIELIEQDGGTLKRTATTHGGEYAGACPWCGGQDRFRVWPGQDGGRYWCRGCNKTGDGLQYLRDKRGLSFADACRLIGREPGPRSPRSARPAAWTPREATAPAKQWQDAARAFLDNAIVHLWTPAGEPMRQWLREKKGLQDATIRKAGLGFNPGDIYAPREAWGLPPSFKDDGSSRRQWLPGGLVIPWIVGGAVQRLRVRRDNPGDGSRYVVLSGSCMGPMAWNLERGAVVIVESELDGLLLSQEAGDIAGVIAMGTATAKPDRFTHECLKSAVVILVSLDSDGAGARASWAFWPATYGDKARRWPTIQGKDAGDARLAGLDLRQWVIAGLFGNEERFERFAIMTVDGGMSDGEALMALRL